MKRSQIITMNHKRYVVVSHLVGKYNTANIVLTPREYASGLERGIKWKKQKQRLMEVM
jgi:hypothetical protein